MPPCRVEQGTGRHRVRDPHRIDPSRRHLSEVALDRIEIVVLVSVDVGPERPICDPAHPQLLATDVEELPLYPRTLNLSRGSRGALAPRARRVLCGVRAVSHQESVEPGCCSEDGQPDGIGRKCLKVGLRLLGWLTGWSNEDCKYSSVLALETNKADPVPRSKIPNPKAL